MPRSCWRLFGITSLLVFVSGLLATAPAGPGVAYSESSTGLTAPQWEGGMTELEFADVDLPAGNNNPNPNVIGFPRTDDKQD